MERLRVKYIALVFRRHFAMALARWRVWTREERYKERIGRLRKHLQGITPERSNRKIEIEILKPGVRTKVKNYKRLKRRKQSNSFIENSKSPYRSENNSIFNSRIDPFVSDTQEKKAKLMYKSMNDIEEIAVVSSFYSASSLPKCFLND